MDMKINKDEEEKIKESQSQSDEQIISVANIPRKSKTLSREFLNSMKLQVKQHINKYLPNRGDLIK